MGMTASRSLSVILLDTESFMSMLSISATPAEYISDSRLQHAIRPKHVTCVTYHPVVLVSYQLHES